MRWSVKRSADENAAVTAVFAVVLVVHLLAQFFFAPIFGAVFTALINVSGS
jgi:hypothetical protein